MSRQSILYLTFLGLFAHSSALVRDHSGIDLFEEEPAPLQEPRTHLVSFRSCSQNMSKLCNRQLFEQLRSLSRLAEDVPSIQHHHLFQGYPPELEADTRWARHRVEGVRGRGYWFWKPAILNLMLKKGTLRDGDVVVWADADVITYFKGIDGRPVGETWQAWLSQNKLDVFVEQSWFCEAQWTKGDIWERFKLKWSDRRYGLTPQVWAQFFILRVNQRTRRLLQMWEELMTDFHLVSDAASESPNPPGFMQNRHDQSILSLLVKGNIPEKSSFLGRCKDFARQYHQKLDANYDRSLHPEFGIANLSAQIGDFRTEERKALQLAKAADIGLQRRTQAFGSVQRNFCVKGSCYDLDKLQGDRPKEVAEVYEQD